MKFKPIVFSLTLFAAPLVEAELFNGRDLEGWTAAEMNLWSVKDGAIVGHSDQPIKGNKFLWHETEVKDFYLSVEVKLTPAERNAGIQFRSKKADPSGQALGYQADVGKDVWGKLYHEHGRGALHWDDIPEGTIKHGEWNHYEILAVGDRIWTAINGTLCVAMRDPTGENSGHIALQIHAGPAQTVQYRIKTFDPAPQVKLAGMDEETLNNKLKPSKDAEKQKAKKTSALIKSITPVATTSGTPSWPPLIAAADPGSKNEAWAQPDFDDSAWKQMKLPAHFESHIKPEYDGVVWFRKTIELPPEAAGKPGSIGLGAIDDMDVTWINGKRVGGYETPGYHFTPRNYPIPANLLVAGKNVIAVRVFDHGWPGGISGKAEQMVLKVGQTSLPLDVPWRFQAGANLAAVRSVTVSETSSVAVTPPSFKNGFEFEDREVVVWMGGTGAFEQQRVGYLETLLTREAGNKPVFFRNMAWQADTVYRRQRPRNFGDLSQQLERVGATMIFLDFGQVETLDGPGRIPEFIAAYELLVAECAARTRRIVLMTPRKFTRPADRPHLPDLTKHNAEVKAYAEAIQALAERQKILCLDRSDLAAPTTDGIQLTTEGHWRIACDTLVCLLGTGCGAESSLGPDSNFLSPGTESLRQAILQKNRLWQRYWRPTNWAFIYGNRQHVPSSRNHRDSSVRWFPKEIDDIIPEIEKVETRITLLSR